MARRIRFLEGAVADLRLAIKRLQEQKVLVGVTPNTPEDGR